MLQEVIDSDAQHVFVIAHRVDEANRQMRLFRDMLGPDGDAGRTFEFVSIESFIRRQMWRGVKCVVYVDHYVWHVARPRERDELLTVLERYRP